MKGLQHQTLRLIKPAIAVMNRLKYPQKFALISCLFILPLGLAMYLLISEIQTRIDFANKEKLGTLYLRPLRRLWAASPQLQHLSDRSSAYNNFPPQNSQAKFPVSQIILSLEAVEAKTGKTLLTTEKFKSLKQTWQELNDNQETWSSENKKNSYNRMLKQIDDLRVQVGNQSNLILDPDLDTYYLMDATLLKLPAMQRTLADIQLLTQGIIIRKQITPVERAQLIMLLGTLKDYNDDLAGNMEIAFSNNPAGNLRSRLTTSLSTFNHETKQLTALVERLIDSEQPIQLDAYLVTVEQSINQSFLLWDKVIGELDFLLQHRIDGFVRRQFLLSSFVLIILGIVLYFFIGFYLGVMQTVSSLSAASKQMVDGTLTKTITLDTRDELAEVVSSFNNIAVALVQANQEVTLLNQRLKAENLRMSAELAVTRKLQEMMLPKESELKSIEELEIAGFMEPANEVGGDYYDVLRHNGFVKIGIGDVTGHGLESSVLMIMVQTAVRTLLANNETDPVKFLNVVNRTIYDNVQRMNSDKNLSLSLLDYKDGILRLSGQHEEMIVVREGGRVERIDTIDLGFPIGLEAEIADFVAHADVQLHPGDVVVLYTDGITEAEDINGVLYGLERLTEVVSQNWQCSAKEIRQAAIEDVRRHIGQQKVYDDITLLVIKQKQLAA
ncbi:MAG TPA: SpoIIE family protein phosphatase [Chroococcales cyanobacterium]